MKPELTKVKNGSISRKIAMGSWRTAADPSVYGMMEIDVSKALKHLENLQSQTSVKLSVSHLVGRAIAIVMKERPEMNGMIRFRRLYLRRHVDLFYQVNVPGDPSDPVGKAVLSGEVVRQAESLSVIQIAQELHQKTHRLRGGKGELTRSMNTMKLVPWKLMPFVLNFVSFLNYDLRINLQWAGVPRDPFGSVMITNVGSLGIDMAWAPLVPYSKVPLLLTVGAIQDRPWAVDGKVEVRPVMRIGITFDHRFMDGVHAAKMAKRFQECFDQPEKRFSGPSQNEKNV